MNAEPIVSMVDSPTDSATAGPWSTRDHAALPARELGPKASVLQARRRQKSINQSAPAAGLNEELQLSTIDAALTFVVRGDGDHLYVARTQRRPLGAQLVHAMVFANTRDFTRWCDADPLRFDDPALHLRLRRHGEKFFNGDR